MLYPLRIASSAGIAQALLTSQFWAMMPHNCAPMNPCVAYQPTTASETVLIPLAYILKLATPLLESSIA